MSCDTTRVLTRWCSCILWCSNFLVSVLLELPVPVVEGADLPGLEPAGDAVEVEGVVTHPPGNRALLAGGARLVCLALDAQVHDVVAADGAVIHHDVPGPQRHRVPLLHLEPLLVLALSSVGGASSGHLAVTITLHYSDKYKNISCRSESSKCS